MEFDYSNKNHYIVYLLTGPTGLKYYGITGKRPAKRWRNGAGYKNKRLSADINSYSFSAFQKSIIAENLPLEEAEKLEAELIERDNTTNPEYGYNVSKGLKSSKQYDVYLFTFKDGKKYVGMGAVPIEKRWHYGYKYNKELYAAITAQGGLKKVRKEHFSYPLSCQSAERIEATLIDYFDSSNPEKGYNKTNGRAFGDTNRRLPAEAQDKISARNKRQMKPVRCIETGIIYDGIRTAARETGLSSSDISKCCKGLRNYCGNFRWEYYQI